MSILDVDGGCARGRQVRGSGLPVTIAGVRLDAGSLVPVADFSPFAAWHCKDMVVDG